MTGSICLKAYSGECKSPCTEGPECGPADFIISIEEFLDELYG
jgi:hypothetical protein